MKRAGSTRGQCPSSVPGPFGSASVLCQVLHYLKDSCAFQTSPFHQNDFESQDSSETNCETFFQQTTKCLTHGWPRTLYHCSSGLHTQDCIRSMVIHFKPSQCMVWTVHRVMQTKPYCQGPALPCPAPTLSYLWWPTPFMCYSFVLTRQ